MDVASGTSVETTVSLSSSLFWPFSFRIEKKKEREKNKNKKKNTLPPIFFRVLSLSSFHFFSFFFFGFCGPPFAYADVDCPSLIQQRSKNSANTNPRLRNVEVEVVRVKTRQSEGQRPLRDHEKWQ